MEVTPYALLGVSWIIPIVTLIIAWKLAVRFIEAIERIASAAEVVARKTQLP